MQTCVKSPSGLDSVRFLTSPRPLDLRPIRVGALFPALWCLDSRRSRPLAARARRKLREDAILKRGRRLKTVYTTEELIVGLQRILKKHGYISARLIDQDPCMPTAQTVGVRFGLHRKDYKLAGWSRTHRQIALAALKSRYRDSWEPERRQLIDPAMLRDDRGRMRRSRRWRTGKGID
jgi:hypothetical protein